MAVMKLPNMTLATKIGAGVIGAVAIAGGTAAITAHTIGLRLNNAQAAPPAATSTATPKQDQPSTNNAKGTARAVRTALVIAEAQVLGITPQALVKDLKDGSTIQALATQKGLSEAQFASQLNQDVKPLLDQQVQAGTLTSAQEQRLVTRYATMVPNWTTVPKAKQAQPQPAPSPPPTQ